MSNKPIPTDKQINLENLYAKINGSKYIIADLERGFEGQFTAELVKIKKKSSEEKETVYLEIPKETLSFLIKKINMVT